MRIHRWPDAQPGIEESVREFVPVAICLRRARLEGHVEVCDNPDHASRFAISWYLVEAVREASGGRVRRVAARALLAPPALPTESAARAHLLSNLGKGVPLPPREVDDHPPLTGRLLPAERRRAQGLFLDEQLALVSILAARESVAAAFSREGDWPRDRLVQSVADRLGCNLVRFSFENIPAGVIRRFRHSRYEVLPNE